MSLGNSNISASGLVFSYDMNNTKSWAGRPTTNYAYLQNPRVDASYTSYSATGSGTWNAKHPDALNVYNDAGTDITGYVNSGVGDWTNTYHAIWTYDYELRRPVVTMRDIDGQWKAKSFGLSASTPAGMGLSIGSTYSISWLSWSDDIGKCANAGMYSRRASDGSYNFWDGQSNSQSTAFNTKPRTWQRVYAVYTVFSGMDINASWTCYMYGHYGNRGTVKIADVQIEAGLPSGFSKVVNRLANSNLESSPSFPSWNTNAGASASGGTLTFANGSYNNKSGWDLYKTYSGLTAGVNYTWSALVKLGTASNLIVTMNNTQSWNTGPATNFTSLNSLEFKRVSITGTTSSGSFNLHLGASFNDAFAATVQTGGTVFVQDVRLERTDSQSSLVDLTGQNTIDVNSLTYAADGTFNFDGSSNYITVPASNIITGNTITIDAWVKTNVIGVYKKIFTNDNAAGIYLSLGPSPYNTYFGVVTNGTSGGATWASDIATGVYTHLVGVYNGSTCVLYANGAQVASGSASGNLGTGSNVYISGYQNGGERWNGQIPAIKVYNRALSASEVQQNFNALRGRYGV